MSSIPTERDWRGGFVERLVDRVVFDRRRDELGLDGEHAHREFFGKSHDEAVEMFREASLSRQEDLKWMPFACFQFYVNAYIEYLRSESARDDADGANAFFSMTHFRLHEIENLQDPLKTKITDTIRFLGNNQKWFDAEPEIYGSFSNHAEKLLAKLDGKPAENGE